MATACVTQQLTSLRTSRCWTGGACNGNLKVVFMQNHELVNYVDPPIDFQKAGFGGL